MAWRLVLQLKSAMGVYHEENLHKCSLFQIFQILTRFKGTLSLGHIVLFLFLYLDKDSLEYLFCYLLLNYLSSSFLSH